MPLNRWFGSFNGGSSAESKRMLKKNR